MVTQLMDDPEFTATTFVVIDFEGTTPAGARPEPIDVAVVHMRHTGTGWCYEHEYTSLIKPPPHAPVTRLDTAQTGITSAMVAGAPPATEVLGQVDALLADGQRYILVAHHAHTEAGIIQDYRRACPRLAQTNLLDTLRLARALYPQLKSHRLDALLVHLNLLVPDGRHRAMPDVKVTAELLIRMLGVAEHERRWITLAQIQKVAQVVAKANLPTQASLFEDLETGV